MRLPSKTTALVLAGAVGISSVAYGIGTQTDGGSANAARENGAQRGDRGPDLSGVADELGVSQAELRDALSDFFRTQGDNHKDDFAAALAAALGKSTEEVQAAFDSLREKKEARFAAKLAAALGLETDQVKTALDELEQEFENEGPARADPVTSPRPWPRSSASRRPRSSRRCARSTATAGATIGAAGCSSASSPRRWA